MSNTYSKPLSRLGNAVKFPFNIFADEEDRVLMRLDELQRDAEREIAPQKRFFKH